MSQSGQIPSPDPARADELLRHAAWLHALARTLVGEADADDVVQETWVAAIAKPPRVLGSLRAWLGTVARNVVRKQARADVRRRGRELDAAGRDPEPAVDEVVARAERMRELVERVLALDEPYRSTILLRFFEGVKPREIAQRVGASEEAVRQRLKRGLDRLRDQLDAEHGGDRERWIAAFAPLTALPAAPAATATTATTTLLAKGIRMSAKTKLAVAGAALVVVAGIAIVIQERRDRTTLARNGVASAPEAASAATLTAASDASGIEARREVDGGALKRLTAESAAAPDAGEPVRFVYGAVVDTSGAAVEGARLQLDAMDSSDPNAPTVNSPWSEGSMNGVWSAAGLAPGRWHVVANCDGFLKCEREFTIDAAREGQRVDLVLRRSLAIPVRFRAPDGRPLADEMKPEVERGVLWNIAVFGLPKAPPARFELGFVAINHLDGGGHWFARKGTAYSIANQEKVPVPADADGVLLVEGDAPAFVVATWKCLTLASARPGDAARGVDLVVDPKVMRDAFATVHARVVDAETKQPIEGCSVALEDDAAWSHPGATTDRNGDATAGAVMPGRMRCEINAANYALLFCPVVVEAGASVDLGTFELTHPVKLHGRVTRADGKPMRGQVSFVDLDHGTPPACPNYFFEVGGDGRFTLDVLGRGRYVVRAADQNCAPSSIVVDTRREPLPSLDFELVAGTCVSMELEKPWPLQFPSFELDRREGDEFIWASAWIGESRIAPGSYRLSVRRGSKQLLELPIEVGNTPLQVTIPRIDDPNGLTADDPAIVAQIASSGPIASKIVGDPIGIVCYGRVVDGERRGLRDGGATFSSAVNARRSGSLHAGCFAVPGLSSGRVEREFYSSVRLPFTDWIDVAPGPALQRRDFRPAAGTQVAITLVDAKTGDAVERIPEDVRAGILIPRFAVIATKEPPPTDVPVLDPDWNWFAAFGVGRFQWQDGSNYFRGGALDVTGDLPVFVSLVSGGHVLHTQLLDAPVARLRLPVDWDVMRANLAGLRIRLVDAATGEVLGASLIEIFEPNCGSSEQVSKNLLPFDDGDAYVRTGLPPGECKLFVRVPEHEPIDDEIVLPPGRVTDLGTIELGAPKNAKGRIVDTAGRPKKVWFYVVDAGRWHRPVPMRRWSYGQSDDNGTFTATLGHGLFQILVSDDRFAATSLEVDPAKEPIDDLRIVLVPGVPVSIRFLPEDVSREHFTIEDHDGHLVASRTMTMGSCRLNLQPGKYTAAVSVNGEEQARDDFEVKDQPVEVALQR